MIILRVLKTLQKSGYTSDRAFVAKLILEKTLNYLTNLRVLELKGNHLKLFSFSNSPLNTSQKKTNTFIYRLSILTSSERVSGKRLVFHKRRYLLKTSPKIP